LFPRESLSGDVEKPSAGCRPEAYRWLSLLRGGEDGMQTRSFIGMDVHKHLFISIAVAAKGGTALSASWE
jgi:hypothetical protein